MKEKIAVYPGTFDPITLGHIDLIERAHKIFDKIIVAITTNPGKKPLLSIEERVSLAEKCLSNLSFVEIDSFDSLLVDFLKKKDCKIILRGLRELSDFESEFQQAVINRKLDPEIDSVFIMTDPKYFYVSSTMVKEIAFFGGNLKDFVPKEAENSLRSKLSKKK